MDAPNQFHIFRFVDFAVIVWKMPWLFKRRAIGFRQTARKVNVESTILRKHSRS